MNPIKPRVFMSFGKLIVSFLRGEFTGDSPENLYFFGTMREGLPSYPKNYGIKEDQFLDLLKILESAGDRVFWREHHNSHSSDNHTRTLKFLNALREFGVEVPEVDFNIHGDISWNTPAMMDFLGDSVEW